MNLRITAPLVLAAAIFMPLISSMKTAQGAVCTYRIPNKDDSTTGTGDIAFGRTRWNWCRSSWLSSNAKAFGMVSKSWSQKGFGWDRACNTDFPTGRFFTSVVALKNAAPPLEFSDTYPYGPTNYSILHWGPSWTYKALDNLKVGCNPTKKPNRKAYTNWNGHVRLYQPAHFYNPEHEANPFFRPFRNVTARAGTLIHEVRHKKGKMHYRDGKDFHWDNKGAWRYHASWLAHNAASAANTPRGQRCLSGRNANYILANAFIEPTNRSVDTKEICKP